MRKLFAFIAVALTLSACGGGYNPDKEMLKNAQSIGGSFYYELGNGQGLMAEALKDIAFAGNFQIEMTINEGGSVTLSTFSNRDLIAGINMVFTRKNNKLEVLVTTNSNTQNWSSYFTSVDATQPIQLTVDIHNNEHPAHILVWQGLKNSGMNHQNTLYNTAEDSLDLGYDDGPGNGFGRSWGFKLNNSQITQLILSTPQDEH